MQGFLENINYKELQGLDVIKILTPLLRQGWYINKDTGKVSMTGKEGMQQSPPWIYVNPDNNRECAVHRAVAETCQFVPGRCMNCWKVVVKMDSIVDLFGLLEWQIEYSKGHKTDRYCKCGVELRDYVSSRYGGYFYNETKTEGLKRLEVVKAAMAKINPDAEVILKRYCTEFELQFGPTKKYVRPENADAVEKLVSPWVESPKNPRQPVYIRKHIMKEWIEFAHSRGDMSYIQFNHGEPLFPKVDTY